MPIPFTQYMRPLGAPKPVTIERPNDIEALAYKVIEKGGKFEIEVLTTGDISMSCAYEEEDVEIIICNNGPEVPEAVDKLVKNSSKILKKDDNS